MDGEDYFTIYGNSINGALMYELESLTVVVAPDYRQAIRTALGRGQRTAPNASETTSHKASLAHALERGPEDCTLTRSRSYRKRRLTPNQITCKTVTWRTHFPITK